MQRDSEKGSITPLIALTMVGMAGCGLLLARVTTEVGQQTQAQTAADAAALAGSQSGREAARRVARANGADVVSLTTGSGADADTVVTVTLDEHRATARARREGLASS